MDAQHVANAIEQLLSLSRWVAALCPTLADPGCRMCCSARRPGGHFRPWFVCAAHLTCFRNCLITAEDG
ncbi:hypothetical protein BD779DRAFT_1545355 [Infundibulicybe gibba]|nr:hypothetical protein BD779DRAFT_1545355 [Infundibulicybe gibba]